MTSDPNSAGGSESRSSLSASSPSLSQASNNGAASASNTTNTSSTGGASATTPSAPAAGSPNGSAQAPANGAGAGGGSRPPTGSSSRQGANVSEVGVRPKPNEPPLPPGWDFSYSDKGRMFFIDHINKTTTWVDPRSGKPSTVPNLDFEARIGPLPVR